MTNPNKEGEVFFRVLVLEDEINTIRGTLRAIKHISTNVTEVKNIVEAQNALINNRYELLIVDVRVPHNGGNKLIAEGGIDLVNSIFEGKYGSHNKNTPFIILSAQDRSIRKESIKNSEACIGILSKLMHLEVLDIVKKLINGEQ